MPSAVLTTHGTDLSSHWLLPNSSMALLLVRVSPKMPRPGTPYSVSLLFPGLQNCTIVSPTANILVRASLRVAVLLLLIHSSPGAGPSMIHGALELACSWLVAPSTIWWACLLAADSTSKHSELSRWHGRPWPGGPTCDGTPTPLKLADTLGPTLLAFVLVVSKVGIVEVPLGSLSQHSPHPGYSFLFSLLIAFYH